MLHVPIWSSQGLVETLSLVSRFELSGPVTRVLEALAVTRGLPRVLRTDNGLEFCGRAMLTWAHTRGVTLWLIEPGSKWIRY